MLFLKKVFFLYRDLGLDLWASWLDLGYAFKPTLYREHKARLSVGTFLPKGRYSGHSIPTHMVNLERW